MTWAELLATNKVPLIFLGLALVLAFFFSGGSKTTSGTTSSWKKWVGWIVVLTIITALVYAGFLFLPGLWKHQPGKSSEAAARRVEAERGVTTKVVPSNKYEASWNCLPGEMFEGMVGMTNRAEMCENENGRLGFNVFYREYGSPEHSWIRLEKVGNSLTWTGEWGQENPRRSGSLTLQKDPDKERWTGIMSGVRGQKFLYTIEKTKTKEVSKP